MATTKEKPVFLASFKAYYAPDKTSEMIEQMLEKIKGTEYEVLVAAPLSYLPELKTHFQGRPLKFGAEVMLSADEDTFTQSIAGSVLGLLSCDFVLIGTSNERTVLKTSENSLKKKIVAALEANINVILAIGESLHDFEDGHSLDVLGQQLKEDLGGITAEQLARIKVLYDAPWIANSCWGDGSEYVPKAYANFVGALKEFFGEKATQIPLFFSIPCFAEHLPNVPKEYICGGYYFGVMTPSHTVEPIHLYSHAPSIPAAPAELSHLDGVFQPET